MAVRCWKDAPIDVDANQLLNPIGMNDHIQRDRDDGDDDNDENDQDRDRGQD